MSRFPYIIHPRRTAILSSTPLFFKWYNTWAKSYTVELTEVGKVIWQEKVMHNNYIRYPGEPQLKAGKLYMLWVTDNDTGDYSGQDPMNGLEFQLLDDKTKKVIESTTYFFCLKMQQLKERVS